MKSRPALALFAGSMALLVAGCGAGRSRTPRPESRETYELRIETDEFLGAGSRVWPAEVRVARGRWGLRSPSRAGARRGVFLVADRVLEDDSSGAPSWFEVSVAKLPVSAAHTQEQRRAEARTSFLRRIEAAWVVKRQEGLDDWVLPMPGGGLVAMGSLERLHLRAQNVARRAERVTVYRYGTALFAYGEAGSLSFTLCGVARAASRMKASWQAEEIGIVARTGFFPLGLD